MQPAQQKLPFFTLLLMISFASVNAVLFTPALPDIAKFFAITENTAQQTISWFLIGYAIGQLLYGPLANRYGRKNTLYIGIAIQILSSLFCVFSGMVHKYNILLWSRFFLALGSGVGLKMTFTLVNECYDIKQAGQKISYLLLAFAVAPGIGVAAGGVLNNHFGWESCFYAGAAYGLCLLYLVSRLPETHPIPDLQALKIKHLLNVYGKEFKNLALVMGGLVWGCSTSFIYLFAALAPFVAINLLNMSSVTYGFANILPAFGLLLGSISSAQMIKHYSLATTIYLGIAITFFGASLMLFLLWMKPVALTALFMPALVVYFGLALIIANASTIGMAKVIDKAHAAAVLSFLNMGFATFMTLNVESLPLYLLVLPSMYLLLCLMMVLGTNILLKQSSAILADTI
jgi:MFS family permease